MEPNVIYLLVIELTEMCTRVMEPTSPYSPKCYLVLELEGNMGTRMGLQVGPRIRGIQELPIHQKVLNTFLTYRKHRADRKSCRNSPPQTWHSLPSFAIQTRRGWPSLTFPARGTWGYMQRKYLPLNAKPQPSSKGTTLLWFTQQ